MFNGVKMTLSVDEGCVCIEVEPPDTPPEAMKKMCESALRSLGGASEECWAFTDEMTRRLRPRG